MTIVERKTDGGRGIRIPFGSWGVVDRNRVQFDHTKTNIEKGGLIAPGHCGTFFRPSKGDGEKVVKQIDGDLDRCDSFLEAFGMHTESENFARSLEIDCHNRPFVRDHQLLFLFWRSDVALRRRSSRFNRENFIITDLDKRLWSLIDRLF